MPTKYKSVEGYFDFADIYNAIVRQAPKDAVLIEIGAWLGRSTCFMGELLKEMGREDITFHAIDTWGGSGGLVGEAQARDIFSEFKANLEHCGVTEVVNPIQASSADQDVLDKFEDGSVYFVFVDGDHSLDAVKADLKNWTPKIVEDGVIAGHDYRDNDQGCKVKTAVNEYFPSNKIDPVGTSWLVNSPNRMSAIAESWKTTKPLHCEAALCSPAFGECGVGVN